MSIRISLCQMDVKLGQPEINVARAVDWIVEAAQRKSDLILFPELWSTGYDLERARELAQPIGKGLFAQLSALAQNHHLCIGGSILEEEAGRIYNTFAFFGSDGQMLAAYRKIHLFRLMAEDTWLAPGQNLQVADTPIGRVGLSICYDLRFPEIFRHYALENARLILIPAEWPMPRIEHWRTLLRARAIENQVFVAAVNRVGESGKEIFGGNSAIIDPWGHVLGEGGTSECLLTADIDLDESDRVRQKINILQDRRPDIYG